MSSSSGGFPLCYLFNIVTIQQIAELSLLSLDIHGLSNSLNSWTTTKIDRNTNYCAHNLAQWAATTKFSSNFFNFMFLLLHFPLESGKDDF